MRVFFFVCFFFGGGGVVLFFGLGFSEFFLVSDLLTYCVMLQAFICYCSFVRWF